MSFQNTKRKSLWMVIAATFMGAVVYMAILQDKDVLGVGSSIPPLGVVIILILITLGLFPVCTLFNALDKWLTGKLKGRLGG